MPKFDDIKTKFRKTQYDYDRWVSLSSDSQREIRKNHHDSYRGYKEAFSLRNKYGDNFTYSSYKMYLASRRYNVTLFFSLLWKILSVLAPLIIISVLLNTDTDFKFDFFKFVNRFSELQFSLTSDLFKFVKNLDSLRMTNMSISSSNNILQNIALSITNVITLLFELVSCIGFTVTFVIDLFGNVFAFLGALVPSLAQFINLALNNVLRALAPYVAQGC